MLFVAPHLSVARAEPTPTEAWLHLEIGGLDVVRGRVTYAVALDAPTLALRLDAGSAVTVTQASVDGAPEGAPALGVSQADGVVTLTPGAPFGAGTVKVSLEFTTRVSTDRPVGFFAVPFERDAFFYSYFEPNHARDAFPCFDEPRFKLPWTVDVVAPSRFIVAANAPMMAVVSLPRSNRWEFARSLPMPSYLVAVAAGPFVVSTVRDVGRGDLNVRVLAPAEVEGAAYVSELRTAVDLAEGWMDAALPWPKLDLVVFDAETSFAAMEHPGVILARWVGDNGFARAVLHHELLHFWFGDIVTPQDWSDVWLSEGPAYWAVGKVADDAYAGWFWDSGLGWGDPGPIHPQLTRLGGLELTARQQVGAGGLFAMLDTWRSLSPSVEPSLGAVLRDYIAPRVGGHADTPSFVAALTSAWPDLPVEAVLMGLLEESATPTVSLDWSCSGDAATLFLTQTRAPNRSNLPPLPVFYRLAGGATDVVLLEDSLAVRLDTCPAWVLGNATGTGFYRVNYEAAGHAALRTFAAEREITARERYALDAKP